MYDSLTITTMKIIFTILLVSIGSIYFHHNEYKIKAYLETKVENLLNQDITSYNIDDNTFSN